MTYRPVVIIGAPRSGTNMLRDVLTRLPGFATWPCDEINFVWKHGNLSWPTDDLPPDRIGPRTRRFVGRQFDGIARRYDAAYVVEKTCANCLRVPFVDALVPEARYLVLVRDGRDAVASALRRWRDPSAAPAYFARKLRFVAKTDLPRVLGAALLRRLRGRLGGRDHRWATWGPVFPELLAAQRAGRSTPELCALQWSRCVEASLADLGRLDGDRVLPVGYERFVAEPAAGLARIVRFLGADPGAAELGRAVADVSPRSVGKYARELDPAALALIEPLLTGAGQRAADVLGPIA